MDEKTRLDAEIRKSREVDISESQALTVDEKYETAYLQSAYDETGLNGDAINWRYWVHQMPKLSSAQAACLMSALEPDLFATLSGKPGRYDPTPNIEKARKIQRLAETQGKLTASPAEWVEWAQAHRISVHTGFLLAVWKLPEVAESVQSADEQVENQDSSLSNINNSASVLILKQRQW